MSSVAPSGSPSPTPGSDTLAVVRNRGLETTGIEIVEESERTARPHDLFWPWFAANVSVLGLSWGSWVLGFGLSFWQAVVAILALMGIGVGATMLPTMTAATRDLEGADTPGGTTILTTSNQFAVALASAALVWWLMDRSTIGFTLRAVGEFLRGRQGAGSVHHIAFRAADDAEQARMVETLTRTYGLGVTEQRVPDAEALLALVREEAAGYARENGGRRADVDEAAVAQFAVCEEISAGTIGPDFERNARIHRAWELKRLG